MDIKDIEYTAHKAGTKFSINALNTIIPILSMFKCNKIIKNAVTVLIIVFIKKTVALSIKKQTMYLHLFDCETSKV